MNPNTTPPNEQNMITRITHQNEELAIIIRTSYQREGIEFFTPPEYSQQLGYMNRPKGYVIDPHIHLPLRRNVKYTNEVLYLKSGHVRVDFYDNQKNYLQSEELHAGDVILLIVGGHGFEMLEDSEIIEVKQGPYAGDLDKKRFNPEDNR